MKIRKKEIKEDAALTGNIIAQGTAIEGNVVAQGFIRLEGKVIGNVNTKAKIASGRSSRLEGNIEAQEAELAGFVSGTVEVRETLVLKPTSIIEGDIITKKLVVESGAIINGKCKMSDPAQNQKPVNRSQPFKNVANMQPVEP